MGPPAVTMVRFVQILVWDNPETKDCAVNVTLFEDALELKVNHYVASGMSPDAAIGRAEGELVSRLSQGLAGADLDCFKCIVQGAAQKMRRGDKDLHRRRVG